MNFKNIKTIRTLFAAFAVFTIVSCGQDNGSEAQDNEQPVVDSNKTEESTGAATVSLPSPLQIASIFKRSGLVYIEGLTNPVSNITNYSSNSSKAVNLGVYSSDMAYCVLNKQNQNSINYLKSSRELANQLGMGSIFETGGISTRFESNLSKEDSLASIIAELQMQSDLFLEENELEHVSAIIFAGAWVESMYIGTKVYEKTNNEKVTSRIVEQMTISNNIVKVLKSHETKDPSIAGIITNLQSINDTYSNFESVKKTAAANEDENGDSPTLSKEEIKMLITKIDEVRNKMIKE